MKLRGEICRAHSTYAGESYMQGFEGEMEPYQNSTFFSPFKTQIQIEDNIKMYHTEVGSESIDRI